MSQRVPDRIPHEYPFRLVERAEGTGGERIGVVLATANGTLGGTASWPISLVVEALAQAVLVTAPTSVEAPRLVGIDNARLLRSLTAGDRLEVEAREVGSFGTLRRYECRALAAGALAATADFTVAG